VKWLALEFIRDELTTILALQFCTRDLKERSVLYSFAVSLFLLLQSRRSLCWTRLTICIIEACFFTCLGHDWQTHFANRFNVDEKYSWFAVSSIYIFSTLTSTQYWLLINLWLYWLSVSLPVLRPFKIHFMS